MKRVSAFICSLGSGGAEHQLIELSGMLVEKGYNVSIITFADISDFYSYSDQIKRIRLGQGKNIIMKLLAVWRYLIQIKTDVFISFGQRENLISLLPLLFRKNIKIICGERNFTSGRPSKQEMFLWNVLYKKANFIVPNSYSQAKYIIEQNPILKDKVFPITNYTNLSTYKVSSLPSHNVCRIGIFGRYAKQKNYANFAYAIKLLKEKTNVHFIIDWFGNIYDKDGNKNNDYVAFGDLINNYKIGDVIRLNNHVKDVVSLMSDFDAIALPSLWEGFSNSISEAICCGKPLLVSDVSDNGIMVKNGFNGYLFNPYDVDSICNAFYNFLNLSVNERKEMGRRSRVIAEELFDSESFIAKYINLIEK